LIGIDAVNCAIIPTRSCHIRWQVHVRRQRIPYGGNLIGVERRPGSPVTAPTDPDGCDLRGRAFGGGTGGREGSIIQDKLVLGAMHGSGYLEEYEELLGGCGFAVHEVIGLPSGFSVLDCRSRVA
jgi:hypothetical protein